MKRILVPAFFFASLAGPVWSDEVTDSLNNAIEAYESGDLQYALEEMAYARQLISEMKTDELTAFLPEAPEGWTREISDDLSAGMAMMGGGAGAEATYSNGEETIDLIIATDSPMVSAMAAMMANAGLMGVKLERIGRQKFVNQDGELTGIIDNRILVQGSGSNPEVLKELLEAIDYKALADFGR